MQGTKGVNTEPQPWSWSVAASKRWHAWTALGDMNTNSAQEMYVDLLKNEAPQWWWVTTAGGDKEATEIITAEVVMRALNSMCREEVSIQVRMHRQRMRTTQGLEASHCRFQQGSPRLHRGQGRGGMRGTLALRAQTLTNAF